MDMEKRGSNMATAKLSYPAPRRCAVGTAMGKYCTQPYTVQDVVFTLVGGGYFVEHLHEFADDDARTLALSYNIQ